MATTLANPLTLVIMSPAVLVTITAHADIGAPGIVGSLDLYSAAALLIGGSRVIVVLRRRVPKIPEMLHAWGYLHPAHRRRSGRRSGVRACSR